MSERQEQAGNGVERLTKSYWLGQDIDTLPRETLMEIIHHLSRKVESMRDMLIRDLEMIRLFAKMQTREELEAEIAALIREHVGVGYPITDGGAFDPTKLTVYALGAAHVVVHRLLGPPVQ